MTDFSSSAGTADLEPGSMYASTFEASLRSVGTAVTLACIGVYLHRRGFVVGEGKRTLALISQQVTFPLFLFTKIIYCNQDWSNNPCPDVKKSLQDVWILLFWPIYVVSLGIVVGVLVARWTWTPAHHVRAVVAACGFANTTGLPITLLTVVHANFPKTSDLGRIDPTLFLSVYLLVYPVLQWGLGGWLLAPEEEELQQQQQQDLSTAEKEELDTSTNSRTGALSYQRLMHDAGTSSISESFRHNVLNNKEIEAYYHQHRHGLSSSDEGLYISEVDLFSLAQWESSAEADQEGEGLGTPHPPGPSAMTPSIPENQSFLDVGNTPQAPYSSIHHPESRPLLPPAALPTTPTTTLFNTSYQQSTPSTTICLSNGNKNIGDNDFTTLSFPPPSWWETIQNIASRSLQPPVVGAIAGIVCAVITPLRALFVDLVDRDASAPLEWIFDGLYSVGLAAVPMNMMILGCNLSASIQARTLQKQQEQQELLYPSSNKKQQPSLLPIRTMVGVVIGKMVVLPIIGLVSCWILKHFVLDIPDEIEGSFYLVMLIVFLTPTANNVMVMVELSGSGAKEGIASIIALQYAVAPIILSLTMTVAIGFASNWS